MWSGGESLLAAKASPDAAGSQKGAPSALGACSAQPVEACLIRMFSSRQHQAGTTTCLAEEDIHIQMQHNTLLPCIVCLLHAARSINTVTMPCCPSLVCCFV